MKKSIEEYRIGKAGAILDEHERAISEICNLLTGVKQQSYEKIIDYETADENCRSMKTICSHILKVGYGYLNLIREKIEVAIYDEFPKSIDDVSNVPFVLNQLFASLKDTLELVIPLTNEWWDILIDTNSIGSAGKINTDILLEHSIVHLLIHRRQLEKFFLMIDQN